MCMWVWNARLTLFIYLYVCILACLLAVWVRDCVSHVRFYERVSVHHQRWRERWKVVGLAGRFQWGRAKLTDIQEELVVTLLPFAKLPWGQTRVVQQLTDYRQVTLLCLLVKIYSQITLRTKSIWLAKAFEMVQKRFTKTSKSAFWSITSLTDISCQGSSNYCNWFSF